MTWSNQPAAESRVGHPQGSDHGPGYSSTSRDVASLLEHQPAGSAHQGFAYAQAAIKINLTRLPAEGKGTPTELFTMSLGRETIELLPFRNWGQLDVYKWRVQGKLPGTPAGLEVASDHVKIAGQTVSTGDPDACAKLEKAFNEWLALEIRSLEIARKKTQARPTPASLNSSNDRPQALPHFRVDVDKRAQVHISCLCGDETLASVGLTTQGFNGLFSQGLMRKPRALQVGALHDWVELDGILCSFEHGNNDAGKLEKLLNEHYAPLAAAGQGKDILIFANAASPTGFDIQFPVAVGGVAENRRRTLNDAGLELLQEPGRCGLLQPGLIIKLSPPTLIFKHKTQDGGEAYLERAPEHTVLVTGDDGGECLIDLSQPVNYAHLSVVELAAVFNHPAVNRHSQRTPAASKPIEGNPKPTSPPIVPQATRPVDNLPLTLSKPEPATASAQPVPPDAGGPNAVAEKRGETLQREPGRNSEPATQMVPLPNYWLREILAKTPIRHDWLAYLVYYQIAQHFANSREGTFGPGKCWAVALGEITNIEHPDFEGVFLTEKGGLGYLGRGRLARFHRGVLFLGTRESILEGINICLLAVGLDDQERIVFLVSEDYASKFGVADQLIAQELARLREAGALIISVRQALVGPQALEVVWSVPADQPNPGDPQALESFPDQGSRIHAQPTA